MKGTCFPEFRRVSDVDQKRCSVPARVISICPFNKKNADHSNLYTGRFAFYNSGQEHMDVNLYLRNI